jgi:hypothetical protein
MRPFDDAPMNLTNMRRLQMRPRGIDRRISYGRRRARAGHQELAPVHEMRRVADGNEAGLHYMQGQWQDAKFKPLLFTEYRRPNNNLDLINGFSRAYHGECERDPGTRSFCPLSNIVVSCGALVGCEA